MPVQARLTVVDPSFQKSGNFKVSRPRIEAENIELSGLPLPRKEGMLNIMDAMSLKFSLTQREDLKNSTERLHEKSCPECWCSLPRIPKLVPEIRIKIWKLLILPRIIRTSCLDLDRSGWEDRTRVIPQVPVNYTHAQIGPIFTQIPTTHERSMSLLSLLFQGQSQSFLQPTHQKPRHASADRKGPRLPIISCISRESRDVFLRLYTSYAARLPWKTDTPKAIWINFEVDVILVDHTCEIPALGKFLRSPIYTFLPPHQLNRLRFLALPLDKRYSRTRKKNVFKNFLQNFPQLETLHFFLGVGRQFKIDAAGELKFSRPKEGNKGTEGVEMQIWEYGMVEKMKLEAKLLMKYPEVDWKTLRTDFVLAKGRRLWSGADTYEEDFIVMGPPNSTVPEGIQELKDLNYFERRWRFENNVMRLCY